MDSNILKGRICDSMADGFYNRLKGMEDDCFYFQINEEQKEFMKKNLEFFKKLIEEKFEITVSNIEFEDDGYVDSFGEHVWTVGVGFNG